MPNYTPRNMSAYPAPVAVQATHADPMAPAASLITSNGEPVPHYEAKKPDKWIQCPGAIDGTNQGAPCHQTKKSLMVNRNNVEEPKDVDVCPFCGLQV